MQHEYLIVVDGVLNQQEQDSLMLSLPKTFVIYINLYNLFQEIPSEGGKKKREKRGRNIFKLSRTITLAYKRSLSDRIT